MKTTLRKWTSLAVVFVMNPLLGYAIEFGGDAFDELPVVLSASRLRQPLVEAPSAVTLIDRAMIKARGVRHIADLMRLVPGATVGYQDGNRPVVALRGMSAVYNSGLQVLVDGVSMYSPLWGGMQWEELPLSLNDIESIEVIRGPNSALYGPNSFSGVINIQTRHPDADQGNYAELTLGEGNVEDATLTRSGRMENGLRYRATMGQRSSNGFNTNPDSQRFSYGNVRTDYALNTKDSLAVNFHFGNNRKEMGDYSAIKKVDYSRPHTATGRREDFQIRWTHDDSADDQWWLQYYHTQTATEDGVNVDLRDLGFAFPTPIPYRINLDIAADRDGLEFQQTRRLSDTTRVVWGGESRRDAVVSQTVFADGNQRASTLLRAYGNLEWAFQPAWALHFATMVERNTLASTGWSPKLTVTWQPVDGHVFRVGTSSALRTPTLLEKKANLGYTLPAPISMRKQYTLSTGKTDSEGVRSDEIGYAFELPALKLRGDTRYFWQKYHGLISIKKNPATGYNDYYNIDRTDVTGGDFSLQWQPQEATRFWLALARTIISSTTRPEALSKSAPETTISLMVDQKLPDGWSASANYQRVTSMFWTDAGSSFKALPPIDYLNLRVSKQIPMSGLSSAEVSVGVINAMGNHGEYYGDLPLAVIQTHRAYLQLIGRF